MEGGLIGLYKFLRLGLGLRSRMMDGSFYGGEWVGRGGVGQRGVVEERVDVRNSLKRRNAAMNLMCDTL